MNLTVLESNVLMYSVFLIHDSINEKVVYAVARELSHCLSLMASTLIFLTAEIALSHCVRVGCTRNRFSSGLYEEKK